MKSINRPLRLLESFINFLVIFVIFLVLAAGFLAVDAWVLLLLFGIVHLHVFHVVPAVGFWTTLPIVALWTALTAKPFTQYNKVKNKVQ